ncbi:Mucin-5B-like 2, partial [Homarus americanus]
MTCSESKWKPSGEVESHCKQCEVFNDPHFWSFDRHRFDYHGECTYALTQEQFSQSPSFGVFAEFKKCYKVPSCVHKTIFKDNPKLVIKIGETGLNNPNIFNLLVNGETFTIPADNNAHRLKVKNLDHDVLVWRHGACVRILGSMGLVKCQNRIDVWAHKVLKGKIYGLCGTFDDNKNNDFTSRSKQQFPLQYLAPANFAESWKTQGGHCNAGKRKRSITEESEEVTNQCKKNPAEWNRLVAKCNQVVGGTASQGHKASTELSTSLIDACTFDLCMIKSGADNPEKEMSKWLGAVQEMTEERMEIEDLVEECNAAKGECDDSMETPVPPRFDPEAEPEPTTPEPTTPEPPVEPGRKAGFLTLEKNKPCFIFYCCADAIDFN